MLLWDRFLSLFSDDGAPSVPPLIAFVRSGEWRNRMVEVEAVSSPTGERRIFRVHFLEGTCLLPWLPDSERVTWILRDTNLREARVHRTLEQQRKAAPSSWSSCLDRRWIDAAVVATLSGPMPARPT